MRATTMAVSATAFAACTLLSVSPVGCGSAGSARFLFDARAAGIARDGAQPMIFTSDAGWTITLTRASVTIGPIFLNVIAPLRDEATFVPWLSIKPAFGDDDHLSGGRVVGEVLTQITFDALSPSFASFPVQGTMTQEQIRTAEIWLWPPPGKSPEAVNIDTPAIEVAGEAVKGEERVRFRGALILNEAWTTDAKPGERSAQPVTALRKVRGLPSMFFPTEGGALEIRFDVRPLFRGADFSSLAGNPSDADGTRILVQSKTGRFTTDQVMRNVFQGMRASTGTYAVRWVVP